MSKRKVWAVGVLLVVAALVITMVGAAWSQVTTATTAPFQAATFDMTIGGTGTHEVSGVCGASNWAPGDDPVVCRILLRNEGSIPINVVWSGFALNGDPIMADNVYVTEFSDSTGSTWLSQIMSFDNNPDDGRLSLAEASVPLGNGYFADNDDDTGTFVGVGEEGYVQLTLAFGADAGNDTIGKQVGFKWTLTAMQTPVHASP